MSGYLVLSHDQWNAARTEEVAGAFAYDTAGPARVALTNPRAFIGELFYLPKAALRNPIVQLSSLELQPIEQHVCDVLALKELHERPPRPPAAQPGAIDYPLWSQIYYAGAPVGNPPENKRRVTASVDAYNKVMRGAVCIRTTTKGEPGPGFPELSDGTIAVAIAPSFFLNSQIRMDPRQRQFQPKQLFLADMARVAEGVVDGLDLHHIVAAR